MIMRMFLSGFDRHDKFFEYQWMHLNDVVAVAVVLVVAVGALSMHSE